MHATSTTLCMSVLHCTVDFDHLNDMMSTFYDFIAKERNKGNKMLSYRTETALQGAFGQKWKTGTGKQYFTDIIGLSSTTVT